MRGGVSSSQRNTDRAVEKLCLRDAQRGGELAEGSVGGREHRGHKVAVGQRPRGEPRRLQR